MNVARWSLVTLLAAIGLGALALSASSTLTLAHQSGVRSVEFAAIAVLELSSIVGTIMWLRATTLRAHIEAAALVVAASAVAAVGGLVAYGLFGLVGPAFLVGSVHVASQEWRKTTTAVQDNQDNPTVEMPRVDETTVPVEVDFEPHVSLADGFGGLKSVGWTVDQIVVDLHGTDPAQRGLQRHIRDHYKVGPSKANKVLDALRMEVAS